MGDVGKQREFEAKTNKASEFSIHQPTLSAKPYIERPNIEKKSVDSFKKKSVTPLHYWAVAACLIIAGLCALMIHYQQPTFLTANAEQTITLSQPEVDLVKNIEVIDAINHNRSSPEIGSLSEKIKDELLSGEIQIYELPIQLTTTDSSQATGTIKIDFNGVMYCEYNLDKSLVTLPIPLKKGDQVGVTCVSMKEGKTVLNLKIATSLNPIESRPLRLGERQVWIVGHDCHPDFNKSFAWYQEQAEQGNVTAEEGLGHMYENGIGVSKDLSQAVHWYQKAATNGSVHAQNVLHQLGY